MATKIPAAFRKLVVNRASTKFRDVVSIETASTPQPGDGEVLVKTRYVGINASDVNYTAGRYAAFNGATFPMDCGFEAMGEIVAIGSNCDLKLGQCVLYFTFGVFAEYKIVKATSAYPMPDFNPEYLPFILSGNTAAIGLDKEGDLKPEETVLVTAAAGGTGQFAVQWAKLAGCHVIGTCSTDEKVQHLKDLGCDRPINYNKENLGAVLKNEYPNGVDVVYEAIGGNVFDTCVENLAIRGRLIVIGFVSNYEAEGTGFVPSKTLSNLPQRLLFNGTSIRGFLVLLFEKDWGKYVTKQLELYNDKKWKSVVDKGENCTTGPFIGLDKIADAVEHMYSKKSIGKIIVEMP